MNCPIQIRLEYVLEWLTLHGDCFPYLTEQVSWIDSCLGHYLNTFICFFQIKLSLHCVSHLKLKKQSDLQATNLISMYNFWKAGRTVEVFHWRELTID